MNGTGSARILSGCGMFMLLVILCLGGAFVVFGLHEIGEAREFQKPVPITVKELVRRKPSHGWFRITDGVLDVEDAVWEETLSSKTLKRVFAPVFGATGPRNKSASIIVETKDPAVLERVEEKRSGLSTVPADTAEARVHYWMQRPVEGRVPGFNRQSIIARRMGVAGLAWRLTPEYVYIAEGEAPSVAAGWGFIGLGLVLVALVAAAAVRMVQEQAAKRA